MADRFLQSIANPCGKFDGHDVWEVYRSNYQDYFNLSTKYRDTFFAYPDGQVMMNGYLVGYIHDKKLKLIDSVYADAKASNFNNKFETKIATAPKEEKEEYKYLTADEILNHVWEK